MLTGLFRVNRPRSINPSIKPSLMLPIDRELLLITAAYQPTNTSVMRLGKSLQSRRLRMMTTIEPQCLEVLYKNLLLQLLLILLSLPRPRNLKESRSLKRSQ
jgi:hypothetical protein